MKTINALTSGEQQVLDVFRQNPNSSFIAKQIKKHYDKTLPTIRNILSSLFKKKLIIRIDPQNRQGIYSLNLQNAQNIQIVFFPHEKDIDAQVIAIIKQFFEEDQLILIHGMRLSAYGSVQYDQLILPLWELTQSKNKAKRFIYEYDKGTIRIFAFQNGRVEIDLQQINKDGQKIGISIPEFNDFLNIIQLIFKMTPQIVFKRPDLTDFELDQIGFAKDIVIKDDIADKEIHYIQKMLSTRITYVSDLLNELYSKWDKDKKKYILRIGGHLSKTQAKPQIAPSKIKDLLDVFQGMAKTTQLVGDFNDLKSKYNEINASTLTTQEKLTKLSESVTEFIKEHTKGLDQNDQQYKSVSEKINKIEADFSKSYKIENEILTKSLDTIKKNMDSTYQDLNSKFHSFDKDNQTKLKSMDDKIDEIGVTFEEMESNVNGNFTQIQTLVSDIQAKNESNLKQSLKTIDDKIDEIGFTFEEMESNVNGNFTQIQTLVSDIQAKNESNLKQSLKAIQDSFSELFTKFIEEKQQEDELRENKEETHQKEIYDLFQQNQEIIKSISNQTTLDKKQTMELFTQFNQQNQQNHDKFLQIENKIIEIITPKKKTGFFSRLFRR